MQSARLSRRRGMWRRDWCDPEEKFTFAVREVALAIVIVKVWWFE